MTHSIPEETFGLSDHRVSLDDPADEFGRLMAPVMAGARARGVADTFELLGIAAVLIDDSGRVLHAGGRVERALLPLVRIVEAHLVGCDARTNDALQVIVAAAIGAVSPASSTKIVDLADATGLRRIGIEAIRFPGDGNPAVQLVRGVLIVTEYAS